MDILLIPPLNFSTHINTCDVFMPMKPFEPLHANKQTSYVYDSSALVGIFYLNVSIYVTFGWKLLLLSHL